MAPWHRHVAKLGITVRELKDSAAALGPSPRSPRVSNCPSYSDVILDPRAYTACSSGGETSRARLSQGKSANH